MDFIKKNLSGILVCFIIAVPAWLLGKAFPVIGGPVIAILAGMLITLIWTDKGKAEAGIKWTSKIILQTAVVLLGFGMNLGVIMKTGTADNPFIHFAVSGNARKFGRIKLCQFHTTISTYFEFYHDK